MKAKFYVHRYFWAADGVIQDTEVLHRVACLVDESEERTDRFNNYLLGAVTTDFSENRHGDVDEALAAVQKIEDGALEQFETGGQGFVHHITRSRVRFEHSVFGECPEYPIWCCTLAQYKAALLGYRRFLDMPKSIDSELTIELPDAEPEDR